MYVSPPPAYPDPSAPSGQIRLLGRIVLVALLLSPLYLWRSGYPQLSGMVLFCGMIVMVVQFMFSTRIRLDSAYVLVLGLGLLTTIINLVYYLFYYDPRLFFSSLYYIYNALAFILVAHLFARAPDYAAKIVYTYIVFALTLEMACALFFPQYSGYRFVGTFNNPNQLGFWALFTCCTLVMLKIHGKFTWLDYLLIAAMMYLQSLSLSKAGLVCSILFLMALPFSPVMGKASRVLVGVFSALLIIFAVFSFSAVKEKAGAMEAISRSLDRLENIGHEGDDNARARGYYRLLEYPQYLVLGAGEGAYFRFHDMGKPEEIHSSLGNILFSYGLIGAGFFMLFFYSVARQTHRYFLVLLFLVLLNGVTHQNIRFTHMWIFVGTAYGVRHLDPRRRNAAPDGMMPSPEWHLDPDPHSRPQPASHAMDNPDMPAP